MKKLITLVVAAFALAAHAACPQFYPNGVAIAPANVNIKELCNSFYVVHYDEAYSRVVFTSARLEPGSPIGAPKRINGFRPDHRIKNSPHSSWYEGMGVDRGHLVAAEDAASDQQMYDTFYLTNVVPQDPTLNRGEWKKTEAKVRAAAVNSPTTTWIVTVPIYSINPKYMANKIPVPAGMWKMAFSHGSEMFFFADNQAGSAVSQYSQVNWQAIIKTQSGILR